MNKELLNYIRHLSKQDRKSLSDKILKTGEEFGELCKVGLPYTNAYATTHRFVKREQILEEAVDGILCNLSVAYDLDFTDAEVEEMMSLKSKKWAKLQLGEKDIMYPLPYEIHITVIQHENDINFEEKFKAVCKELDIKPVFIDNQFKSGKKVRDVLTSCTHFGNNASAYEALKRITIYLNFNLFNVIREKIETVPWHPASPKTIKDTMPENCYFEAHIGIIDTNHFLLEHDISCWNSSHTNVNPLHLSDNPYKNMETNKTVTYITLRMNDVNQSVFEKVTDSVVGFFENHDWKIHKVHKEFAIYDSNVSHDAAWLTSK